jgi:hypothetical protein
MPDDVPAELRSFISEHIGSILQLELLLQLAADPQSPWDAARAAKTLYVTPEVALGLLEGMRVRGLLAALPEGYRFQPQQPACVGLVRQLADLYKERRLTVTGLIYSAADDKLREFADAFRIRKQP